MLVAARGARQPSPSGASMRCRPRASRARSIVLIGHLAVAVVAIRLDGGGRAGGGARRGVQGIAWGNVHAMWRVGDADPPPTPVVLLRSSPQGDRVIEQSEGEG